ncbi:MAG: hypothetical protein ACI35P_09180 [Bacillus sp. (in: firmicutes)]
MEHMLRIIDFNNIHHHSIYVKVIAYDAESGKEFKDEIRFLDGMIYGDLVHPQRSPLSPGCREYVRELLLHKYNNGDFH